MNIKTFLAGAVCGGIVVTAVDCYLLTDRQVPTEVPGTQTAPRQSFEARQHSGSDASEPAKTFDPANVDQTRPIRDARSHAVRGLPGRRASGETQIAGEQGTAAFLEKRRSDMEAEPKDDSWAYHMEQTISQFLAYHPAIIEFEVSCVECRTTFCQIQVIGFDDSTGPTWSRIMHDLLQSLPEKHNEFGSSSYDLEGRHAIVLTIGRGE